MLFLSSRTPRSRTETLLLPKQACFQLHLYPMLFVVFAADDSVGAYLPCQWAGRRSNPRLRCFKPPLDHLSYQPISLGFGHEKRPDVCVTPGLLKGASKEADVTCANDKRGHHYSAVSRRRACLRISVRVDWIGISITWNFLLACQALNCRVQRVRRESVMRVRQESPSHTTTMRETAFLFP